MVNVIIELILILQIERKNITLRPIAVPRLFDGLPSYLSNPSSGSRSSPSKRHDQVYLIGSNNGNSTTMHIQRTSQQSKPIPPYYTQWILLFLCLLSCLNNMNCTTYLQENSKQIIWRPCFIVSWTSEVVSVMLYPCIFCVALLMDLLFWVLRVRQCVCVCELFGETICNVFGCSCFFVVGCYGSI